MVPVATFPLSTELGLSVRVVGGTTLIVSTVVEVSLPRVAEIFAVVALVTTLVVTAKVAVVAPAAMVALAGTVAEVESEASVTVVPPVGAALVSVIVAVEFTPPTTAVGLSAIPESFGGFTVRDAVFETVPSLAEIVAVPTVATGTVVTLKVPVLVPPATVTVVGTVAKAESEERFSMNPASAAMSLNVTVATDVAPP